MRGTIVLVGLLIGCQSEQGVTPDPPLPPPDPPGSGPASVPPEDWSTCAAGFHGAYTNLTIHHPDVTPRAADPLPDSDPTKLDWWDQPEAFQRFDASLDFGQNWWPVDDGLEDDPAYFSVYWTAWLRAYGDTTLEISLGSADDAWIHLDGVPIVEQPGIQAFERRVHTLDLDAGVYPLEVRFAHRGSSTAAMSFRILPNDDVDLCEPEYYTPVLD